MHRHGLRVTWLLTSLACCWLAALPGTAAQAAAPLDPAALPYFVRVGVTAVISDITSDSRLAGSYVPNSGTSVATVPAAYVEAGYYVTNAIAVSLAGGYPPTFISKGTGAFQPFGTLYKAVVGLPVLEATYHLDLFGPIRPYAGLGVGYAIVFDNKAGALTSPKLRDQAALVLVGGVDYAINANWGVFVDVKKAFLTQKFTGVATPFPPSPITVPASAQVRTDPILVTAGLSYRF